MPALMSQRSDGRNSSCRATLRNRGPVVLLFASGSRFCVRSQLAPAAAAAPGIAGSVWVWTWPSVAPASADKHDTGEPALRAELYPGSMSRPPWELATYEKHCPPAFCSVAIGEPFGENVYCKLLYRIVFAEI